jgi:hypothetical protein
LFFWCHHDPDDFIPIIRVIGGTSVSAIASDLFAYFDVIPNGYAIGVIENAIGNSANGDPRHSVGFIASWILTNPDRTAARASRRDYQDSGRR